MGGGGGDSLKTPWIFTQLKKPGPNRVNDG